MVMHTHTKLVNTFGNRLLRHLVNGQQTIKQLFYGSKLHHHELHKLINHSRKINAYCIQGGPKK